jgi:hypothetical protein
MNDAANLNDPELAGLLDKLRKGQTDFTADQLRILRKLADWCLSVEAAQRLARMLKGPSRFIGPILIAILLWKAGILNLNQAIGWMFDH